MDNQSDQPIPFIERHGISPILFALLSLIIIFILYQIIGGIITLLIFGMKLPQENIFGYRIATGIGQIIFILIPTLLLVRFASFNKKEFLRLKIPKIQLFLIPIVGIFSLQQILQIYLVFQEKLPLPEPIKTVMQQFKDLFEKLYKQLVATDSIPELIWVIFIVALIPAVTEELLFRGLIQRSFEKGFTPLQGAVATGIIFGAYHMNPFSFVPLAIIGIYLGFLTFRTGSVWVAVAAHFYNNLFACIALYIDLENDNIIFGSASEMPTEMLILIFWFFGVIFLLSFIYFLKITKPIQNPDNSKPKNKEYA